MRVVSRFLLASLSFALSLQAADLVKITTVNPDIRYAKIRNTQSTNFYLIEEVARKLSEVQKELENLGLCLVVYEAYVPYSSQKKSIEAEECLRHSCGMAVDVGLEKLDGTPLSMPTEFDVFGPEARSDYMDLPAQAIANRNIVKRVMERHGFKGSENLWYHFECVDCNTACYLDVSLENLA